MYKPFLVSSTLLLFTVGCTSYQVAEQTEQLQNHEQTLQTHETTIQSNGQTLHSLEEQIQTYDQVLSSQHQQLRQQEQRLQALETVQAEFEPYVVQEGDSLLSIAEQHQLSLAQILAYNPHLKTRGVDLIYVGERIQLN